jgi:hypothetical protein
VIGETRYEQTWCSNYRKVAKKENLYFLFSATRENEIRRGRSSIFLESADGYVCCNRCIVLVPVAVWSES